MSIHSCEIFLSFAASFFNDKNACQGKMIHNHNQTPEQGASARAITLMLENHTCTAGFLWRYGYNMRNFVEVRDVQITSNFLLSADILNFQCDQSHATYILFSSISFSVIKAMCRGILPQKFLDRWCSINPYIVRLRGHLHGLGRHHIEDVEEMLNREGKRSLSRL